MVKSSQGRFRLAPTQFVSPKSSAKKPTSRIYFPTSQSAPHPASSPRSTCSILRTCLIQQKLPATRTKSPCAFSKLPRRCDCRCSAPRRLALGSGRVKDFVLLFFSPLRRTAQAARTPGRVYDAFVAANPARARLGRVSKTLRFREPFV